MEDKCINCIYYGSFMMACFNMANEGIRVLYPEKNSCNYFEPKITLTKIDKNKW